ncbi:MAG: CDP-glucose 4,6-dehydratase [Actinomycetota bacterium]|nr:CDP-glucose 4,6-dehydratase [Actinomycetota bacterium]
MTHPFWSRRRVLVTGHTGFKGAWLSLWLQRMGAVVTGFGLPPEDPGSTFPSLAPWPGLQSHLGDIRDAGAVAEVLARSDPEVVFHLAAQALVHRGYQHPFDTYHTNVIGAANLLSQLHACPSLRTVVVVTSDKVYENNGERRAFVERDRLRGNDPYSSSKALTELLVAGWRHCRPAGCDIAISTARAGNVIGGGDRAPDRLLPDAWRALEAGRPLALRFPEATRPWQFVLEPLYGYLLLAEHLTTEPAEAPQAVNFGPEPDCSRPVREVVDAVFKFAGTGTWQLAEAASFPEASSLHLDVSLAREALGWAPRLSLDVALAWTVEWWRARDQGADLRELASAQIAAYEDLIPA